MDFVIDCLFSIDSLKSKYDSSSFREFRLETHLTEYMTGSINSILYVSLPNCGQEVNECAVTTDIQMFILGCRL